MQARQPGPVRVVRAAPELTSRVRARPSAQRIARGGPVGLPVIAHIVTVRKLEPSGGTKLPNYRELCALAWRVSITRWTTADFRLIERLTGSV